MATYHCTIRTNYFHVKDEEKFQAAMKEVCADNAVSIWEEKDQTGCSVFCFGVYGRIFGINDSCDEFIERLQECVADNDAIIIIEAGNESLRYVTGKATIITSHKAECFNITRLAEKKAMELLGNPAWETKCEY